MLKLTYECWPKGQEQQKRWGAAAVKTHTFLHIYLTFPELNANPVNTKESSERTFYIGCLFNGSNNSVYTSGFCREWQRNKGCECVHVVRNPVSDFKVTFLPCKCVNVAAAELPHLLCLGLITRQAS